MGASISRCKGGPLQTPLAPWKILKANKNGGGGGEPENEGGPQNHNYRKTRGVTQTEARHGQPYSDSRKLPYYIIYT